MFVSFFPQPRIFFLSAMLWTALCVGIWYGFGTQLGSWVGVPVMPADAESPVGPGYFITPNFLFFYAYSLVAFVIFATFWFLWSPHPYQMWSIVGSALIIFSDYYSVQVSVAINAWYKPFYDLIQESLDKKGNHTAGEFYGLLLIFCEIAFVWVGIYVLTRFFTSHYVFRWRTAMNNYYMSRWPQVRTIEGASQRVQEDTMKFASIVESLGIAMLDSLMTLFAFLPVLMTLSKNVSELPIVGAVPYPLVVAAILWSLFGTILLWVAGIRLPGLNFMNQRVEAAYRKELVYGEDDPARAAPSTVVDLFAKVRRNYFRLYFHYVYFNIFRGMYIQADNVFATLILVPTIVLGKITFGTFNQITNVFGQVSSSFQYLVSSWTTIIELISIYKRLRAFEAAFEGKPLASIESAVDPT